MSRRVALTPLAGADVADAFEWYEVQQAGLGERFLDDVGVAMTLLSEFGEAGPTVHGSLRRVLLRRFPYAIYYTLDHEVIEVRACLHLRRDRGA